ncbi:MAG: hypothetical protein ACRDZO_04135, partial [Egibacteraceae bacterium]
IGGQNMAPILPIEARDLESAEGVELLAGDPDDTVMLAFNPDGPLGDRASAGRRNPSDRPRVADQRPLPRLRSAGRHDVPAVGP